MSKLTASPRYEILDDDNNITHLVYGPRFNEEVNELPFNLTHLTFGIDFNQTVNKLPPNITHLTFGSNFNQSLKCLDRLINLNELSYE
jgi:hypothetical protein